MERRLFAAVELPRDLRDSLAAFQRKTAGLFKGARWTDAEDLHITVCFFGQVAEERIGGLKESLGRAVAVCEPFELVFSGVDLAPPRGTWRSMIWASFTPQPLFAILARAVRTAADHYAPSMPEEKTALPHVTLARFREPVPATAVAAFAYRPPLPRFVPREVVLFESRPQAAGRKYSALAAWELNSSDRTTSL